MNRARSLVTALAVLLACTPPLAAAFEVGDFVFPKTTPGSIKVGETVIDEVEISDYLIVSKVEGAWLWVECRDLLAPSDEGKKGWIAASSCDDIETQINYFDGRGRETQSAGAYFLAGAVASLKDEQEYQRRALNYFSRAIELDPAMSYYRQRRASCHVMLGDYQSAITDLEEAGRLDPSNTAIPGLITQVRDLMSSGGGPSAGIDVPPPTAPVDVAPDGGNPPAGGNPSGGAPSGGAPSGDSPPSTGGQPGPGQADPRLRPILLQTNFNFTINSDGNYKIILDVGGGRTQVIFVESNTEMLGTFEIREIWSPIGQTTEAVFPANIADRLLRVGSTLKIGAVEVVSFDGKPTAYFSAKVPPDLDAVELTKVINAVATTADENENSLFGGDTY